MFRRLMRRSYQKSQRASFAIWTVADYVAARLTAARGKEG
jgi:hypothetical protein